MNDKYLSTDEISVILNNAPKEVDKVKLVDKFVAEGYVIQGFNEPKPSGIKEVAKGLAKGAVNTAVVEPAKMVESVGKGILSRVNKGVESLTGNQVPQNMQIKSESSLQSADTLLSPTNPSQEMGSKVGTGAAIVAPFGPALVSKGVKGAKAVAGVAKKGKQVIGETVEDALFTPTTEEATKTTLNPFIEGVADVSIPVKQPNGLVNYVVKKSSEATPQEIQAYKDETQDLYTRFTDQANKFLKDRSVEGGSPVEQVGTKIDTYVKEADKIRKNVGKAMGNIEDKSLNLKVGVKDLPDVKNFLDVVQQAKAGNIANYGADEGVTKEITKLGKDLATLEERGSNAGETLSFTRRWAQYLENQKDKFGDFKDNKFANSAIESVVNSVKNAARDTIAENDEVYKKLVKEYRKTSQFKEEAKRLLGQEGLYGSTIKGAATAKRAIQSNSDAGARQFLKTLRDLTGYDGIKEADIALKAMKDVGDYQGLSLLGILNDAQGGVINAVKGVAKKLTPSEAKRTKRYIEK